MLSKKYTVEAIVLKNTNYKDRDKLYTLYTRELGKIVVLAKGVRKITSRRAGNLDTLNHVSIAVNENTAGFKIVEEAKALNSFRRLKMDLEAAKSGFYLAEVLYKSMEDSHPNEVVYSLVLSALGAINDNLEYCIDYLCKFQFEYLRIMGYGPVFDRCVICDQQFPDEWLGIHAVFEYGGFVCSSCWQRSNLRVEPRMGGRSDCNFGQELPPEVVHCVVDMTCEVNTFTSVGFCTYDREYVPHAHKILAAYVEFFLNWKIKSAYVFDR